MKGGKNNNENLRKKTINTFTYIRQICLRHVKNFLTWRVTWICDNDISEIGTNRDASVWGVCVCLGGGLYRIRAEQICRFPSFLNCPGDFYLSYAFLCPCGFTNHHFGDNYRQLIRYVLLCVLPSRAVLSEHAGTERGRDLHTDSQSVLLTH